MAISEIGISQWDTPLKTPSMIQVDFGPWGHYLPGDGFMYCGPTSVVMALYWLALNGFTQLAPDEYGGPDDLAAANVEKVVAEVSINPATTFSTLAAG